MEEVVFHQECAVVLRVGVEAHVVHVCKIACLYVAIYLLICLFYN